MKTVIVHRCHNDLEADQIRELLLNEGIECQIASDIPHSIFPLTMDGLGEIRIAVLEEEAHRAQELIKAFLNVPEEPFNPEKSVE